MIEAIEEVAHPSIVMTPGFDGLNREVSIVATASFSSTFPEDSPPHAASRQ
jgi:hypothetical protein